MAEKSSGDNKAKGADFGRGTKNMPEQDHKQILKGQAPKMGGSDGKPKITDKTS